MSNMFFDAYTRIGPRVTTHGSHPWSMQHLRDEMAHCSISGALVTRTSQTVYDAHHENLRLCDELKQYDNLFPVWNVLPHWTDEFPEPAAMTKLMQERDVRAAIIHPKTNGWNPTSKTSDLLLRELEKSQTLTMLSFRAESDEPTVEHIVQQYPNLPLLLRGAWWSQARAVLPLVLTHKNLHLAFDHFQVHYALEWLCEKGCEDQLLFASNAPEMSAGAHRSFVDWAEITQDQKAKVASGNLIRLLKGLKPPREMINSDEDEIMAAARQGKPLPCLTLDMHAHILTEGLNGGGGGYQMINGGPSGVRKMADRMGVDGIGLMSWIGTVGAHAQRGNEDVIAALDAQPDFFWGLGTFDVMHESAEAMTRQMEQLYADKRFLGLKPYPQYGIPYDDSRYDCWWEFGNKHHLYCGLHPVKWYQEGEFASICERFPNLTVVAYHCGANYDVADTAIALAKRFKNFMLEPTLTPSCGGIIDYLVEGCGVDRVMYGSDLPMRDPRQQLGWIVYSRLPVEQKKQVLGQNAKRLIDHVRAHQA